MRFFCFGYNGVLVCHLSFRAFVYGTKTGVFSRRINFVIFACLPAKVAAAHSRTFFARTKKGAKKVRHSALPSGLPYAVKLRLRFCSACFTAILKISHFHQTHEDTFLFLP